MACPDPTVIAATASLEGNPVLAEHLKECPSCRLDWQIVHGARHALYGPGVVQRELNERAMARIVDSARQLQRPPTAWEQAASGVLVAVATGGMLLLTGPTFSPPILPAVISMVASGGVAVLLLRNQASRSPSAEIAGSLTE